MTKFLILGSWSNGGSISRKVGSRKNKKGLGPEAGLLVRADGSGAGGAFGMLGSRSQQDNHEDRSCSHLRLPWIFRNREIPHLHLTNCM